MNLISKYFLIFILALIEHLFQEVPETCPLCDLNSNNIDARSQVTCDLFGILLQNYQTDTMEIFNEYFQTLLLDQRLTLAQISNVKQHLQTQNVAVFITAACVLKKSLKFLAPNHVMLQLSEIRNIVSNHSLKWNFISALFRTENVLVHRNRYSNATNATNLMEYVQIFSNDNVIDEINADIFSNKKFEDFRLYVFMILICVSQKRKHVLKLLTVVNQKSWKRFGLLE